MENPFRSMIIDVTRLLPDSCQTHFLGYAESLFENSGGFNRAFGVILICSVWILTVPGRKRRDDAEKARDLRHAERLKSLDRLIDKGHIIPFSVRWPLLTGFILGPLIAGWMMLYVFRAGAEELYWRPMASGPGFTIRAVPGEDPVCYLYSPAAKPSLEESTEEGWYVVTPFLLPPRLKPPTRSR